MKQTNKKSGFKKQLFSGAVYAALGITVVAFTVNTVSSSFLGSEKSKEKNYNVSGDSKGNAELALPKFDYTDWNLDMPVSDSPEGVDAKVAEKESAENVSNVKEHTGDNDETMSEIAGEEANKTFENVSESENTVSFSGYVKPCAGFTGKDFSDDLPVYSATMSDYRTHNGIDIVCEIGTPVKAVTGGVISEIYTDVMMGQTVVIDHENGIKSVYSNLSADLPENIKVGKHLVTGEVFAGVGETSLMETAEASHLHFEMIKDDVHVDPTEYVGR